MKQVPSILWHLLVTAAVLLFPGNRVYALVISCFNIVMFSTTEGAEGGYYFVERDS